MYLYNENGKHLGWFTWKDAYEVSKNIDFAVYSFTFVDKMPKNNVLPFQLEDTFYIGMSCGRYFDKKNRTPKGGTYVTYLQKRLLIHNKYLSKPTPTSKKSKMFFEHYNPLLQPQKQRFVSISIPDENMDDYSIRAFISLVESEHVFLYTKQFGQPPLLNLDEQYKPNRKKDSISNRVMSSPSLAQHFG
jgi:hypothetical protein